MCGISSFKRIVHSILTFFFPPDPADIEYENARQAYRGYSKSGALADLNEAISMYESALALRRASKDKHNLASLLVNYTVALWDEYKLELDRPTPANSVQGTRLSEVISLEEEALKIWRRDAPEGDSLATLLTNLANAYWEQASLNRSTDFEYSYQQCLALNEEVYENTAYSTEVRCSAALGIAQALLVYYNRRGSTTEKIARLERANAKAKYVLKYSTSHNDYRTMEICLDFLAQSFDSRYELTRNLDDLSNAIEYNQVARKTLPNSTIRTNCLYNLSLQILRRYDKEPDPAYLKEAKTIVSEGTAVLEPSHPLESKFKQIDELISQRQLR